jgi:hypothetical protein
VECRRRIDRAREDGTQLHGKDAWIRRAVCVHHIKELKDYPEERLDDDNLISLCHECHDKVHGRDAEGLSHYRYTKKFSPEKEKELSEKYDIDDLRKGFRTDEPFDLKEFCSNRYDIDKIKQIINAMIEFEKDTGETPEYIDLIHIFGIEDD